MVDSHQQERRTAQRFDFNLPVAIKLPEAERIEFGFTQNICARGAFFYADCPVVEGIGLQLTFTMPSEITLMDNLRVRCCGHVMRVEKLADGIRAGIAVSLGGHEFLPTDSVDSSASSERICSLHEGVVKSREIPASSGTRRAVT
jgi:hypothetical protein